MRLEGVASDFFRRGGVEPIGRTTGSRLSVSVVVHVGNVGDERLRQYRVVVGEGISVGIKLSGEAAINRDGFASSQGSLLVVAPIVALFLSRGIVIFARAVETVDLVVGSPAISASRARLRGEHVRLAIRVRYEKFLRFVNGYCCRVNENDEKKGIEMNVTVGKDEGEPEYCRKRPAS